MLLTEEEAKTKWCPFVRLPDYTAVVKSTDVPVNACATNRTSAKRGDIPTPSKGSLCIASACMAWRIAHDDWSENAATGEKTFHMRGYCGLAGKP